MYAKKPHYPKINVKKHDRAAGIGETGAGAREDEAGEEVNLGILSI